MIRGTIRNWISHKGFGFIRPDSGGTDVFVHINEVDDSRDQLTPGDVVEFEVGTSERSGRVCAKNVRVLPS
jgi:CspA family cold shock protein